MVRINTVMIVVLFAPLTYASEQGKLANAAFNIEYGAEGITSLKRTGDVYDTEYIAPGGSLGSVLIRYERTTGSEWRQARQPMGLREVTKGVAVGYTIGALQPTLAAQSTPSASPDGEQVEALNDQLAPRRLRRGANRRLPRFTWRSDPGSKQWVQYTFPEIQEVSSVDVFWYTRSNADNRYGVPESWRLLYSVSGEWREVEATSPYGLDPNKTNLVVFTPVRTAALRLEAKLAEDSRAGIYEWRIDPEKRVVAPLEDLRVAGSFKLEGDALIWTLTLANLTDQPIEIGDLALPLAFNTQARSRDRVDTYTKRLIRHSYVAGNGSWVFWQRSNAIGSFLVMTPFGKTKFEYFDARRRLYTAYIHAAAAYARAVEEGGNWRLPTSSLRLAAKGSAGDHVTYGFKYQWGRDFNGVRDVLYREGQFDTNVVPGMTIPTDLPALVSLRTGNKITKIQAEFPKATRVDLIKEAATDTHVYRVQFSRLGENMLTVHYGDGEWMALEFFVTEPLETIIKKHAAFLISHQQHTDPKKWYNGLISDWDARNRVLRSPDDRDGLRPYVVACDDPGNGKAPFVASKCVFYPNQTEIDGVEYYIKNYLWGGMQMTTEEPYPYAIYGIPNYKVNRESSDPGRNGQKHLWRIYDYPHIIQLYYHMYQLATFYPDKVHYLDADGYLKRAYGTAMAFFTVPMKIQRWSAYRTGTYNEIVIPGVIEALEAEGKQEEAKQLRYHWERKVKYFVNDQPYLFGSEFAFDSTGFESTGAFAHYAMEKALQPGEALPAAVPEGDFLREVTFDKAAAFLEEQLRLNAGDRGWLETNYYNLGSDYRAFGNSGYVLSYMAQMGGWSIVDYALYFAKDPTDTLRLGYASFLSSWALVNSGTSESNYGYWFPGKENDGFAGGGFEPQAVARAWIGKRQSRGSWFYNSEIDLGYSGALRTAATIVTKDPVFGEFAYGGLLKRKGDAVEVIPRDGLRVRFHVVRDSQRLHIVLERDGFAREQSVVVNDELKAIQFTIENRTGDEHRTGLKIDGLPPGDYSIAMNGKSILAVKGGTEAEQKVMLPLAKVATAEVTIARVDR